MICPQCNNGGNGLGGMTTFGSVHWCETCGTIVDPAFGPETLVPTLVRRVAWMLDDNVQTAKRNQQNITDIMGVIK